MQVALVLHAHLPWVKAGAAGDPLERWLHEALWECYLPLCEVLAGQAVTLSVSPTLAGMLCDRELRARFRGHLDAVESFTATSAVPEPVRRHYLARVAAARAGFEALGHDVLAAWGGAGELMTTAATHAVLVGLGPVPGAAGAQLAIGALAFEALGAGPLGGGRWLPECAYDRSLDAELWQAGMRYTVLDGHALSLAAPSLPAGEPLRTASGVLCFGRDALTATQVWSPQVGYPGNPSYRDFHREADGPRPPPLHGGPTGVKPYANDGGWYDPRRAGAQAERDALDFVAALEARAARGQRRVVAAYDAELFGHWWWEGPVFLRRVIEAIGQSPRLWAVTLAEAAADGVAGMSRPEASSWGAGGFHHTWLGPRSARLWRVIHGAHRRLHTARLAPESRAEAIRELLLLEASDWLFMVQRGVAVDQALARLHEHAARVEALCAGAPPRGRIRGARGFLGWVADEVLCAAFDQPPATGLIL